MSMTAIGSGFVEAFNRRDADALVAVAERSIEFHPSVLVGEVGRVYRGHEGLRRWLADMVHLDHQVQVLEVDAIDKTRFAVVCEVLLDDEPISPLTILASVGDEGLIAEAHVYLSDEETLVHLGRAT